MITLKLNNFIEKREGNVIRKYFNKWIKLRKVIFGDSNYYKEQAYLEFNYQKQNQ